jgi:hypothetical protein
MHGQPNIKSIMCQLQNVSSFLFCTSLLLYTYMYIKIYSVNITYTLQKNGIILYYKSYLHVRSSSTEYQCVYVGILLRLL